MGVYGGGSYAGGFYGGGSLTVQPTRGAIIQVFDPTGALKGVYESGVGNFLGISFTLDESGPRNFSMNFANSADIGKKDQIKVKLRDSLADIFNGVVRTVPIDGSTNTAFEYSGFGFNDYLLRVNTEAQNYTATTINAIIIDLLDNIITNKTPITKNLAKIDTLSNAVTDITFNFISVKQALDQLKKIADADGNDYRVGVDEDGDFFFKARDTETKVTLTVGKKGDFGIEEYDPFDTFEAITKLFILRDDGTFFGNVTSLLENDIFEEKITAPDIDDADVQNWAEGILKQKEVETREAAIEWQIEEFSPLNLKADGNIRVISNVPPTVRDVSGTAYGAGLYGSGLYGGGPVYSGKDIDDTLKIKEITYNLKTGRAFRSIQLGALPIELDRQVIAVNQNIEDLRASLGR